MSTVADLAVIESYRVRSANDNQQTALELLCDIRGRTGFFRTSDGWDIFLGHVGQHRIIPEVG